MHIVVAAERQTETRREGDRQRHGERETETRREGDRQRHGERETDRDTERERQRDRKVNMCMIYIRGS